MRDGVGSEDFLHFVLSFFSFFFAFLRFLVAFVVFLRFFPLLSYFLRGQGKTTVIYSKKWGISLRPRLHRPRAKLPKKYKKSNLANFWGVGGGGPNLEVSEHHQDYFQKFRGLALSSLHDLSGPLRLRVQSRLRTRLRIAASIALLFRTCFKGGLDTIAPRSRD